MVSSRFGGSQGQKTFLMTNKNISNSAVPFGATRFCAVEGGESDGAYTTTEGQSEQGAIFPMVFDLMSTVFRGTHDDVIVMRFRVNNLDGNQVLTVPALSAVLVQDTTNRDVLALGDMYNYEYASAGGIVDGGRPSQMIRCVI